LSRSNRQIESLESRRLLAGTLDPFFGGNGGERVLDPTAQPDQVLHLARGLDDSIYIAAQSGTDISLIHTTSVGTNESVIDANMPPNLPNAIAVDFDTGRIAVASRVQIQGQIRDKLRIGLFDFNTQGPVNAFDNDGYVDLDIEPETVRMAWQAGRLIVGVSTTDTSTSQMNDVYGIVTRLGIDGKVDTTFGTSGRFNLREGIFTSDVPTQSRTIEGLEIDSSLRVVVATKYIADSESSSQTKSIDVYRLTENGSINTSFSGDGKVTLFTQSGASIPDPTVLDLRLRGSDTIATLWSLTPTTNATPTHYISSLDEAGGKSSLFSGVVTLPSNLYRPNQLGIEAGGRYVVAGMSLATLAGSGAADTFVARFNKSGGFDPTYGSGGIYLAGVGHFASAPRIIVQKNDDVVIAATTGTTASQYKLGLARLLGDQPTVTLNKKGTLVLTTTDADDVINLYIRSRDGRLMVNANTFFTALAPTKVKRIAIFSSGGDDVITIGDGVKGSYADAGDGNDTLNGGQFGDVFLGGAGKDDIFGNDGDDILLGGASNDYLLGGAGKDDLFGNGGTDTLSGAGGNDRLFGGEDPDLIRGGTGTDSAATDEQDSYEAVETMLV
jgi:Ca2+-binding RTX toxin-like protein